MVESILQSLFINILNPVFCVTGRISEKTRTIIIQLIYLVIFTYFVISRSPKLKDVYFEGIISSRLERYIICTILVLLIAVLSINAPLHKIKWRPSVLYLQMLFGLGMIVISFIHPVGTGYRMFGFQMIFLFPCLWFVWNNRGDYESIFRSIVYPLSFIGIVFFVGNYYLAFKGCLVIENLRCAGIMSNANCFSLVGMEMFLCGIYLLATERHSWIVILYTGAIAGMGTGIIIVGQMRIAILTVIICSVVTGFYYFKYLRKRKGIVRKDLLYIVLWIAIALLMVKASAIMIDINQNAIAEKQGLPVVVEDSTTATDQPDVVDRIVDTQDNDLNMYTSGRIMIWKNYAAKLNLLGNNFDEYDPVQFTGREDLPYAHNIFLELAYRFGIPVGVIAMVYYFICGIICIGFLFSKEDNKPTYLLFPIICCIAFALEAILDCAVLPFFQAEDLLFYLSTGVIIEIRRTNN